MFLCTLRFSTLLHNNPAAHQDHCGRFRIRASNEPPPHYRSPPGSGSASINHTAERLQQSSCPIREKFRPNQKTKIVCTFLFVHGRQFFFFLHTFSMASFELFYRMFGQLSADMHSLSIVHLFSFPELRSVRSPSWSFTLCKIFGRMHILYSSVGEASEKLAVFSPSHLQRDGRRPANRR